MATQLASRRVALAVGIILLAIGAMAVISIVKQRGEAARHNEITKVADERLKEMEAEGAPIAQNSDKDKKTDNTDKENQSPVTENSPVATPGTPLSTSELPQTGASDILALIPIGMLTFALAAYIQSRRV